MADKKQELLDSIKMINNMLTKKEDSTYYLDPIETSLIIEFNKKHLENEKSKVDLTQEEIYLVESKIEEANKFIQDNPIKEGGGTKPISPSIVVLQDCKDGFIFALDFSPNTPLLTRGKIYKLSASGYRGCGQVISPPQKTPIAYSKPMIESEYEDCSKCLSEQ